MNSLKLFPKTLSKVLNKKCENSPIITLHVR